MSMTWASGTRCPDHQNQALLPPRSQTLEASPSWLFLLVFCPISQTTLHLEFVSRIENCERGTNAGGGNRQ
jgi:hypothetical protein